MLAAARVVKAVAGRRLSTAAASVFATPEDVTGSEVVLVDCSGPEAFRRAHLQTARRLPLPPSLKGKDSESVIGADVVTQLAAELGIARNSAVVAYDDNGGLNAARFWWVMSLYGKSHVRVLRKGWYGAASEGFPLSLAPDVGANSFAQSIAAEDPFVAEEQAGWRATLEDVVAASSQPGPEAPQLLDVRSLGEWEGHDLRGNPRGGHLPNALHLPHSKLTNGFFCEDDAKTREAVAWSKVDTSRPVITFCQSGVRAAHTAMMLRAVGAAHAAVFDESMFSVTRQEEIPLETGRGASRIGEL